MRTSGSGRIVVAFLSAGLLAGCGGDSALKTAPASEPVGESEAQERFLQALIRTEPRHWRAKVRLSNLTLAAGRPAEAFEVLREAAKASPKNVAVQTAVAQSAKEVDYLDWRLYSLLSASREAPQDASLRLDLAELYRRLGWARDAAAQLAVAAALEPNSLRVLTEQASFYSMQGQFDDTRRCARTLTSRYPKSPYGYSLLADLAATGGRWKEAVDYGRRAMEQAPRDSTFKVRQAQYLLTRTDAPDPQSALMILDNAALDDPQNALIQYWRGVTLRRLGQEDNAVRALESAYSLDPAVGAVKLQLAELYRAAGQKAQADSHLAAYQADQKQFQSLKEGKTALAVDPLAVGNHLRMAKLHLEAGAAPEALVEYLTARRMKPDSAEAKSGIAAALAKQERAPETVAPL